MLLELISITKSFKDGSTVVNGIDLNIKPGQVVALIGSSGSGKTTILQIAGLLDQPTSGAVIINGINCTQASSKQRVSVRRDCLGFVYQFHHLLQELSVLENVMLPQLIAGKSKSEAQKNAKKALEIFNLGSKYNNMVSEVSGGERQRVAIARAVVNSPKLLLADEPTGNLDPLTSSEVFLHLYSYIKKNNGSMLIVTHNHSIAEKADCFFQLQNKCLVRLS
ncbi:ABC transporter ATP-binding protein [Wolbachia pipientis]|uniref:ABC transporter ATP-binding protein n=1 Tax=Wolbachia pipientis TaxID=955 RepID=A0A1E7QJP2_WOLPI|nr:ABC transporter ATP-binding protein [Wolbachia pipientis]OEY86701.1 ABC transporter ATP-binding protein [Wolbachia pipientis]